VVALVALWVLVAAVVVLAAVLLLRRVAGPLVDLLAQV